MFKVTANQIVSIFNAIMENESLKDLFGKIINYFIDKRLVEHGLMREDKTDGNSQGTDGQ